MKGLVFIFALFFVGCQSIDGPTEAAEVHERNLLLTFDDFPCQREGEYEEQYKINRKILDTLQKHNTSAMVFVNSSGIYRGQDSKKRERMLDDWAKEGHDIGNHTYSHPPLSKTTVFDYEIDILKCEPILKRTLHKCEKELKYFRYPFLDYGKNIEQRQQIKTFLRARGYEVIHVTLDTLDWKFNKMMYDGVLDARSRFIVYAQAQLDAHIHQANGVVLFHVNKLTSECLDEIIQYAKLIGYKLRVNELQKGQDDAKDKL